MSCSKKLDLKTNNWEEDSLNMGIFYILIQGYITYWKINPIHQIYLGTNVTHPDNQECLADTSPPAHPKSKDTHSL